MSIPRHIRNAKVLTYVIFFKNNHFLDNLEYNYFLYWTTSIFLYSIFQGNASPKIMAHNGHIASNGREEVQPLLTQVDNVISDR